MGKMEEFNSVVDDGEAQSNEGINATGDYTV